MEYMPRACHARRARSRSQRLRHSMICTDKLASTAIAPSVSRMVAHTILALLALPVANA
jgi:hypothetical protein